MEDGAGPAAPHISIHAPREGSDLPRLLAGRIQPQNFYPRSPRGERRRGRFCGHFLNGISIHAPREGSDGSRDMEPPVRIISIHAPREGSDW